MQIHYLLIIPFHFFLFYFITHTPPIRPITYDIYAIFHSFIIRITIYYAYIYYLTTLILFTPLLFYFILLHTYTYKIHSIQSLRNIPFRYYYYYHYNTIPAPRIYYTNIFTTQYNLTYTYCNSCPQYTFTNQILTH